MSTAPSAPPWLKVIAAIVAAAGCGSSTLTAILPGADDDASVGSGDANLDAPGDANGEPIVMREVTQWMPTTTMIVRRHLRRCAPGSHPWGGTAGTTLLVK